MTPVKFKFLTPGGTPIANTKFHITLRKAAFHAVASGLVPPDVIEAVTNTQGEATVSLFPANQPYYVTMTVDPDAYAEDCCSASLKFRIAVPDVEGPVNAHTLIVTDPIFSQAWDAAAIEAIMIAKAEAITAANQSTESAEASQVSAEASAASAAQAEQSAQNSEGALQSAIVEADRATTQANLAEASASASANSASEAATEATNAAISAADSENSAINSLASATASQNSRVASEAARDASAASAAAALTSQNAAAASAQDAESSANASQTSRLASEAARDVAIDQANEAEASAEASQASRLASEAARDVALSAAASMTGSILDGGAADLSGGVYPPKPDKSTAWKVTVGGTVDGVEYGIGDTLVYTKPLDEYYKIDNTDAVSSVNGYKGIVNLGKGDVGLGQADNTPDANKPVSAPQQTALNTKVDKVDGKQLSTEDYSTAEKDKLAGIAVQATKNATDAELRDRTTHTGQQPASTISDFTPAARAAINTGFGLGVPNPIAGGTDLNSFTQPGRFIFATGAALVNAPIAGSCFIEVYGNSTYPIQEVRLLLGNAVYRRTPAVAGPTAASADWNPWELLGQNQVPVVIASAATLSIGALYTKSLRVTGTVAISNISTALPVGTQRELLMVDGATFTAGGNVTLPGTTALTTSPGDLVVVQKVDALTWRVQQVTRGDGSMLGRAISITAAGPALDLSSVTAEAINLSLTGNITSVIMPTATATGRRRRLDINVTNTGVFDISGWTAAGVVYEAGARPLIRPMAGALTRLSLERVDTGAWTMLQSFYANGQATLRVAAAANRATIVGAGTGGVQTNAALVANRIAIIPFTVSRRTKLSALGFRVGTASASGAFSLGIYQNNGDPTRQTDLPGSILVQTPDGALPGTPAGLQSSPVNVTLLPGEVYWAAMVSSAANAVGHFPLINTIPLMGYNTTLLNFPTYYTYVNGTNSLPAVLDTSLLIEQVTVIPVIYLIEDVSAP